MSGSCDILLISPPPWDVDNPPVNLAVLAEYLEQQKISVACMDLNIWLYRRLDENLRYLWLFENSPYWKNQNSFQEIWQQIQPVWDEAIDTILAHETNVFGISVADSREFICVELIRSLKARRPDCRIVLGGPNCASPGPLKPFTDAIPDLVDCYVVGEGELTLEELIERFGAEQPIDDVRGLWLPAGNGAGPLVATPPRPAIRELDRLPFPTYGQFDLSQYRNKTLVMVWSRGCVARCTFCDVPGIWGRFRFRGAQNIFDEIVYNVENNNIRDFMIYDSVVNGNIRELERLCDMIIDAGLPISWQALVTPRRQMSRRVYFKMARAGCHRLEFGIESGADKVLANMRKMFNSRIAAKNLRDSHDAGIQNVCFIMVGFPGETELEFNETIEWLDQCKDTIDTISTVNTAIVLEKADLSVEYPKYHIEMPENRSDYHWSMPGNNYHVRRDRAVRMVEALERIGIPLTKTNLLEGENHCSINTAKTGSMEVKRPSLVRKSEYFRKKLEDVGSPDLLLVMCPPWGTTTPPLGIAYLAMFASQQGYQVDCIDFNIECYNRVPTEKQVLWDPSYAPHWTHLATFSGHTLPLVEQQLQELVSRIVRRTPGMIGFTVHCDNMLMVLELIKRLRERLPFVPIVCGGMQLLAEESRKKVQDAGLVDVCVVNEGERPLVQLMDGMRDGQPLSGIKGLQLFEDQCYTPLTPAPLQREMDQIPWPDFARFDLAQYDNRMLPLLYCRGCIAQCTFCDDRVIMGGFRIRSPEHMLAEIVEHVEQRGVRDFIFNDLLLNSSVKGLDQLCDAILERGLDIRWMGNAIVRKQMTPELLAKMRAAGCWALMYGIESGSAKVLKLMKKMFTPEMADVVLRDTAAVGIEAWCNFIVGFPGEGEAELEQTIDFINRNKAHIARIAVINKCNVLPETPLYNQPEKYRIKFPERGERDHYCWYTSDGNTDEVRALRVERILELLDRLDIPIGQTNYKAQKEEEAVRASRPGDFLRKRSASMVLPGANGGLIPIAAAGNGRNEREPAPSPRPDVKHHVGGGGGNKHLALFSVPPWGVEDPPVGIGYLGSYLRKRGWDISIYDMNAEWHHRCPDEFKALWAVDNKNFWKSDPAYGETLAIFDDEINAAVDRVLESNAPYIGFSVVDPRERLSCEVAARIKAKDPSRRILLGGASCFTPESRAEFYGDHGRPIDAIVGGEGEITTLELLESLEAGNFSPVPGAQLIKAGQPYGEWVERPAARDVDSFGFPTYTEGFPFDKYVKRRLVVTWSRSCAGACSFCKEKAIWGSFRSRTPGHVVEELQHHIQTHGIRDFAIFDSAVNSHPGIIEAICDEIIAAGLDIRWQAMAIPRKAQTPALLAKMKRAGCHKLIYGVESGSDKVLKQMRKMFMSGDAEQAIRNTHDAGIKAAINILLGFPAEGEREFQETLNWITRNADYISIIDSLSDLQLVPGTIVSCYSETFGIEVPQHDGHYTWTSEGNTIEMRKERIRRVAELARELGVPVQASNTYDEGKEKLLSKRSDEIKLNNYHTHVNKLQTFKRRGKVRREVRFDKISKSLLIVSPFYPMRDGPGNLDAVHSMLHCYDHSPLLTNLNTKYFLDSKQEDRKAHWINAGRVLAADHQQTYEALTAEILDDLEKNLFTRDLPRFAFHSHPTGNLFLARLLERMSEQMDDPQYILDMTGPASEVVLAAARRKPPMEIITPWALAPLFGAAPVQVSPHQPNESAGRMASASRGGRRDRLLLAGLQEAGSDALLGLISQLSGLSVDPWQAIVSLDDLQGVAPESLAAAGCDSVLIHLNSVSDSFFDKLGAPYRVAGLMDLLDGLRSGGVAVDVSLEIGHPYETDEHYYDTLRFFRDGRELIRRISALATYLIRPGSRFDPSAEQEGLCYPRILPLHNWHDRWVSNFMYRGKRLRETIIYLLGQGYDFPSRYIPGNGPFLRHRKRIEARLEREVAGDRVMVSVGPR